MANQLPGEEKVLLFIGDSITDANRLMSPDGLGWGYVHFIFECIRIKYPELRLRFINRGISGNRLADLELRWQKDCINMQPDYVSILIGINDTWRIFDQGMDSPIHEYEARYRNLLQQIKTQTQAEIILCSPFVLPDPPDRANWRKDVNARIAVTEKLAEEFKTKLVPFDQLFDTAAKSASCLHWLTDGVHPTKDGYELMSDLWLQVFMEDADS